MIEIRELVIEARIVDGMAAPTSSAEGRIDEARVIEEVVRRVLMILNERRERL